MYTDNDNMTMSANEFVEGYIRGEAYIPNIDSFI